ncbi:MAG: hypothetical protein ACLFQJ_04355 [Campylobacterales bacterium]
MAKIEKVRELIGYLKIVFGVFIAVGVSLVGWLFQNSEKISDVKIIVAVLTIVCLAVGIIVVNKKILSKIDELEDL